MRSFWFEIGYGPLLKAAGDVLKCCRKWKEEGEGRCYRIGKAEIIEGQKRIEILANADNDFCEEIKSRGYLGLC